MGDLGRIAYTIDALDSLQVKTGWLVAAESNIVFNRTDALANEIQTLKSCNAHELLE